MSWLGRYSTVPSSELMLRATVSRLERELAEFDKVPFDKTTGTPFAAATAWRKAHNDVCAERDDLRAELAEAKARDESLPDDLREKGWMVAVHNDYRINGERKTFWLLTYDDGQYVKGEGATDAEALNEIRAFLGAKEGK